MDFLVRLLSALLPVAYFASARRAAADFRGERAVEPAAVSRRVLEGATLALHVAFVAALAVRDQRFPTSQGSHVLNLLALAVGATYFVASHGAEARGLGMFVAGGTFVLQLGAAAFGFEPPAEPPTCRGGLFHVHVVTAVLAAAVMLLSGLAGILYLLLERQMRRKTFGLLFSRLPNLAELATLNRRAARVGFLVMAVGVNWGIWLAHDADTPGFSYRDPQVVASLALWAHFGLIALPRRFAFVTGRRAATAAAAGCGLLILTLLVSAAPGLSFHRFG